MYQQATWYQHCQRYVIIKYYTDRTCIIVCQSVGLIVIWLAKSAYLLKCNFRKLKFAK